jgi:CRISPR-associated protein Cas1
MFQVSFNDELKEIPVSTIKSIIMNDSTSLTFAAVKLAAENEIDLLFMEKTGKNVGRLWSNKFGSISVIRKNQLKYTASKDVLEYMRKAIVKRTESMVGVLYMMEHLFKTDEHKIVQCVKSLEKIKFKIESMAAEEPVSFFASLRGYEGKIAAIYFDFLGNNVFEIYRFKGRSRMPAEDMFNALLNYSYGMLYGKVESALIRAGLDPFIGFMHRDDYNRPVLVYDIIELYRSWAEYVCLWLCSQMVVFEDFFDISENSYLLNDYGKKILIQTFNDYLNEIVEKGNNKRSRETHIFLECQSLANNIKNIKL